MRRRQSGAALVEFAIIAPLFLVLVFAVIDIGLLLWAQLSVQHAVREGGRVALTMQAGPNGQTRDAFIVGRLREASFGVDRRLETFCIDTSLNGEAFSTCYNEEAPTPIFGAAGERVRLRVAGCWPLLTPVAGLFLRDRRYCFRATSEYRNEP